jgi:uncharacterized protein (UPF0335 family)
MSAGHNSVAGDQLRTIIERVERLEQEKRELAEDIKEVYGEAKGNGFDTAVIRAIVRRRKEDAEKRKEREAIMDVYLNALGMLD